MSAFSSLESLRAIAEKQLAATPQVIAPHDLDALQLLHELQVHKVEVDMQHEAMTEAFNEADALRARYMDLYNLAPVGYFTLSGAGTILEVNQRGAAMLGKPAGELTNLSFKAFFADDSLADLDTFLVATQQTVLEVSAEWLHLRRRPLPLYVNAQAKATRDLATGQQCIRMALMDVTVLKQAKDDMAQALVNASIKKV